MAWTAIRCRGAAGALLAMAVAGLAAGGAAVSLAGPTDAGAGRDYGVTIQRVLDQDGDPLLVANFTPNAALATPTWSICRPNPPQACRLAYPGGAALRPGPEPAGTRFVATARYHGRDYSSAVTWHGRVQALTSPGLRGTAREGDQLDPVPARWEGGWAGDFDQLGVEACLTASGRDCRMLGGGELGCPDGSSRVHLEGWFTSWYVFALDGRLGVGDACAGTGYSANANLPLWKLGPTVVRSRALGRITGPPRPTVAFLNPARLSGDTLYVASVRAVGRCVVYLSVEGRMSGENRRFTFSGTKMLGVSSAGLAHGPLAVSMEVDDSPLLRGRSTFQ